jgi:serine/threonine protein kinase
MAVALAEFVEQLEASGILPGDTLKDFLPPKGEPKSAKELALELVRQKRLTKFQVEEVSKGKGKSLVLGNYVLIEKIGAGGMGQVFKAEHRRMHRIVAVKVLPGNTMKDPAAIARFEREVTAAAKLRHPNIIAADDADQANGVHFLVMEFVDGSDLSALVKQNGPFSVDQAVNYILQAAKGLEFAHAEGVVHRDIKPANLLLDKKGTVKILDMGLARIHGVAGQAELTSTGTFMGTVDYMAPEQALNTKTADARADVYALGCSLYYLLTGRATYEGDTLMAKLLAHRDHPIPDLRVVCPQVQELLEIVFKKMVAKKVEDRFQTMTEVIAALEGCGRGLLRDKSASPNTVSLTAQTRESVGKSKGLSTRELAAPSTVAKPTDFLHDFPLIPIEPLRTQKPKTRRAKSGKTTRLEDWKKPLLIGAAVLGVMIFLAAVVMRLKTKDGTLVVTVNEPDAEVQILDEKKETVEITRKGDKGPITITVVPGKHRLKVQKDGFELFTDSFEIKSGNTESITANLVPLENAAVVAAVAGGKPWESPAFQQWMKDVAVMPAEGQVEAVVNKLRELNPGFDGKVTGWYQGHGTPVIEDRVVLEVGFSTDNVTDISPIRALTGLRRLGCSGHKLTDLTPLSGLLLECLDCNYNPITDIAPLKNLPLKELQLAVPMLVDISPLKGMKLEKLLLAAHKVNDISVLKGMPLHELAIDGTQVADLSPLRGMALTGLNVRSTPVSDLSPLTGMPLTSLDCCPSAVTDLSPLAGMKLTNFRFIPKNITKGMDAIRQMKSFQVIGTGWSEQEQFSPEVFWKKYDAGEFGKPTSPGKPITEIDPQPSSKG